MTIWAKRKVPFDSEASGHTQRFVSELKTEPKFRCSCSAATEILQNGVLIPRS